ncbi:oxygen-sensing cyclic-di-GMP phosphodiesterase [Affinibrenneria salicis]|uniref:Oxygen-sensing cyclic-di-GMP phosphodiesterase n=1 Tax=Affinibrenneria salicis TaxID=2590031 RepID=A0A5J5FSZ2_9GAMM|nr:oxygen-sensing cyclic-di-GMP phosphodiesterase DosP [Affinibrenneria salicis]KAA8996650.1 oxygen-sensing cyclic-di-GMP phosphodiesterase [Affinibrenneria salicis]
MQKGSLVSDVHHFLLPALEQTIVAVVLIDENDRVLFFNEAAERLWGYSRGEILGRHMNPLLPRALRKIHGDYTSKNRLGGQARVAGMSREILMERKDGQSIWAIFSLSKINVAGRIHYMAMARDISDEVARREETRLLLLAINHTDRVVFVLDPARRIVQINRAFSTLFGYQAGEAIGKSAANLLLSPKTDAAARIRLRGKARAGQGFSDEIRAVAKDGRDLWVRFSVNPVFDKTETNNVRNLVVALSDVTEERQIRDLERDVLQALTSSLSFGELGNFLCRRIESIAPGVLVSVCEVVDRKLRPWAAPSFHASYGPDWEGVEIGEGVAGCGTAAHRGEPVMVYDIATDPLWAPYRHQMLPHGFCACWTYPVKRRDGSVAATFAFYFRQGGAPNVYLERIADASVHLCTLAVEREENQRQIARMIRFNPLTGLPNLHSLHNHIDELLNCANGQPIGFFCIDLDRFRDINSTLGHTAGDQVIVTLANRLQDWLKPEHFLSHVESRQFIIVAQNCNVAHAYLMADEIQRVVRQPISVDKHRFSLSASVGISHYQYDDADRDALLANARSAMYQVRSAGSGAYQFFSPEMNLIARDRLLLGAALRQAIAHGDLHLYYQPQVCPRTGALYGVEALARWQDDIFGDVPPGKFIGLAEEIGEIEAIGRWALREACRQMAAWRAGGISVPTVSVNLSPVNFRRRDLTSFIAGLLLEYALPGQCLTLEITESMVMELTQDTLDMLQRIRALGIGLSIDDFGTGFSSLSRLASLPVTEVKIDRSFIGNCLQDNRLRALVLAVIGIGRSLSLTVVAEGVETGEQCQLLNELACPVVQGYLFSRPLPPQDVPDWLRNSGDKSKSTQKMP